MNSVITTLPLPKVLWVPLTSAGKNARLLVKKGDKVSAGATLAVAGDDGADICAPAAGRIGEINMRPLAATHTKNAACLMLECEKAGGDFISHVPLSDVKPQNADPRPILKAGGIVGLGGGVIPLGENGGVDCG